MRSSEQNSSAVPGANGSPVDHTPGGQPTELNVRRKRRRSRRFRDDDLTPKPSGNGKEATGDKKSLVESGQATAKSKRKKRKRTPPTPGNHPAEGREATPASERKGKRRGKKGRRRKAAEIRTDVNPLEPSDEEAQRLAEGRFARELSEKSGVPAKPSITPAKKYFDELLDRLRSGEGDELIAMSGCLEGFELGLEMLTVVGGPPGVGKTALAMQCVFQALEADKDLTVLVANAEMSCRALVRRELCRRTGVSGKSLRFAQLTAADLEKIEAAASELAPLMERFQALNPPYASEHLQIAAETLAPGLMIVDYLQKFASGDSAREGVNRVMQVLREAAMLGWAVLALSSTSRTKTSKGSAHDSQSLGMASFRDSSDIEFNADAAYVLRELSDVADDGLRGVDLDCVKNRHGERVSHALTFDAPRMRFVERPADEPDEEDDNENPFGPSMIGGAR